MSFYCNCPMSLRFDKNFIELYLGWLSIGFFSAPTPPVVRYRRRPRGKKLWEFILDLLHDPDHNPSIIRWDDQSLGVFRLINPEAIAKKWGERRKKNDLSYDNFARALRWVMYKIVEKDPDKLVADNDKIFGFNLLNTLSLSFHNVRRNGFFH